MRSTEEIMADMPEDMRERAEKATKTLLGFVKAMADPEAFMPKTECKVCGENRSQDLVAHGPGVARFMYYPCRHSEVHKDHVSTWYDENDNEVEV
ncbi:hypothetical protein KASHIRA_01180 [Serratia phage vB_SmaM-Kashira]|nr:hypothetical protein KASHIRA_01180 [Serratia phage vB_SmaM-Kashira]